MELRVERRLVPNRYRGGRDVVRWVVVDSTGADVCEAARAMDARKTAEAGLRPCQRCGGHLHHDWMGWVHRGSSTACPAAILLGEEG